jgi:pyruvate dehydrogenase E2 component (dihydrolipoamide acetyltransferase)
VAAAVPATGQIKASPVARRLADELGVSLSQITGTGPGGRITKTDVQGFSASTPAPATPAPAAEKTKEEAAAPPRLTIDQVPETIQLSPMRRAIARVTSASNRDVPHFYVMGEIEMDGVMELRSQVNRDLQEQEGLRLSVNDFIIKASARALAKFPNLNAFFEGDSLKMNKTINVGVAMDLKGQGLMIPALMDVGSMSLVEISKAVRHLAERARSGHLTQEEYTAGTFTVSNLGMFNVDNFVAIIFPPQAAVLATGSVKKRPVVRDDQIVVGQVMNCTLSIDHRISDGAEAAQFMGELKRLLESPALLLM